MRGFEVKKIILAVAMAVFTLSACDTGISTPGNGVGREGWWLTPLDSNGFQYECFYWSLSESSAIWCKPDPIEHRVP